MGFLNMIYWFTTYIDTFSSSRVVEKIGDKRNSVYTGRDIAKVTMNDWLAAKQATNFTYIYRKRTFNR